MRNLKCVLIAAGLLSGLTQLSFAAAPSAPYGKNRSCRDGYTELHGQNYAAIALTSGAIGAEADEVAIQEADRARLQQALRFSVQSVHPGSRSQRPGIPYIRPTLPTDAEYEAEKARTEQEIQSVAGDYRTKLHAFGEKEMERVYQTLAKVVSALKLYVAEGTASVRDGMSLPWLPQIRMREDPDSGRLEVALGCFDDACARSSTNLPAWMRVAHEASGTPSTHFLPQTVAESMMDEYRTTKRHGEAFKIEGQGILQKAEEEALAAWETARKKQD